MNMGRKIGCGFTIILLLTLALGYIAINAMQAGVKASADIAQDRVPRFMLASAIESDVLEFARLYFVFLNAKGEREIKALEQQTKTIKTHIDQVRELNNKNSFSGTTTFLEKFPPAVDQYAAQVRSCVALVQETQKVTNDVLEAGKVTEAKMETLIAAMGKASRSFMASGQTTQAALYSQLLADVSADLSAVGNIIKKMLLAELKDDDRILAEVLTEFKALVVALDNLRGKFDNDEYRALLDDAVKAMKSFGSLASDLASVRGKLAEVSKERTRIYDDVKQQSLDLSKAIADFTTREVNEAETALSSSTTRVTMILAVVLIIGILTAVLITRMIVKPLAKTQIFAQAVADGDLDRQLDVHAGDATGMVAEALRSMVNNLKKNIQAAEEKTEEAQRKGEEANKAMAEARAAQEKAESAKREGMLAAAGQLEEMVNIISSASNELSAQIEQSDRGAAESAQRLSEAATAMNEMNATVQEVAKNAGTASGASSDTREKAENGARIVEESLQSFNEVRKVSIELKDDMAQLNEHAQAISRIMGVISDIADQTNLLALNAAIEAARAGEAGRGFAVVADEVRKLAEKTMASTNDVGKAIQAIQDSTDKSMSSVDNAVRQIEHATELANKSGQALEEIVTTVESTADQVNAIATASEEQSATSEEINRSILEVNEMSRQTAEAMGEAAKAVGELVTQAHGLTELINELKRA